MLVPQTTAVDFSTSKGRRALGVTADDADGPAFSVVVGGSADFDGGSAGFDGGRAGDSVDNGLDTGMDTLPSPVVRVRARVSVRVGSIVGRRTAPRSLVDAILKWAYMTFVRCILLQVSNKGTPLNNP